jgi:hypothetical protein
MSDHPREKVLQELAKLLEERNKKRPLAFLSHPFVLMLIGTLFVSCLVTLWNTLEQRNLLKLQFEKARLDQKYSLLKSMSYQYQTTCSYLNDWVFFTTRYMDECTRSASQQSKEHLEYCKTRATEAEKRYREVEPLQGILYQVHVIYTTDEVKMTAKEMVSKWKSFADFVSDVIGKLNSKAFSSDDVKRWEGIRKRTIDELEALNDKLSENMRNEIAKQY